MSERLILHEYALSANCYKIRLTAALVGKQLQRQEYDIMKGETRSAAFLASVNANGRIPVLQVGTRFIPESNAASYFIAASSPLIPQDRFDHADMLHWLFWEQYSHEPNIATLRSWLCAIGADNLTDAQRVQMPLKRQQGDAALKLMNDHLASREWFVGSAISLADICLFAYTHVAGDADFDLGLYPHVSQWIDRIKSNPRFVPMAA